MNNRFFLRFLCFTSLVLLVVPIASTDPQTPTESSQDNEYHSELNGWRAYRRALKTTQIPEAEFEAQWTAAVRCLYGRAEEILNEPERAALELQLYREEVRRTFMKTMIAPRVVPTDDEVDKAVQQSVAVSARPEGVRLLEIFLWAPSVDPELRRQKLSVMEEIQPQLLTVDGFRDAAQLKSDATSAFKMGQIGTIYRNQVPESLWTALKKTEVGLTPIIETPAGLFRFYVLDRLPAHQPNPETIAPTIQRKIAAGRAAAKRTTVLEELRRQYEVSVADPLPTTPGARAATIGGKSFSLSELLLGHASEAPLSATDADVARAVDDTVMLLALQEAGTQVTIPHSREVVVIGERVLEKLTATEMSSSGRVREIAETAQQLEENNPPQKMWSFSIVRVAAVEGSESLFELFRIRHETGAKVEPENLANLIRESTGLTATVETYTTLTDRKVAGLGPEIHQTLRFRCSLGTFSRPLHIADRAEAVFIRFEGTEQDVSSNAEGAMNTARTRIHAEVQRQEIDSHAQRCSDSTNRR